MRVRRPTRRAQLRIELVAEMLLEEILARHAMRFGQTQQAAFERHQTAVDAVHLVDKRFDAVVVELEALDEIDRLVAQLLEAAFLAGGEFVRCQGGFDATRPAACRASCRALAIWSSVSSTCGFSAASIARERQIAFVVEIVGVGGVGGGGGFAGIGGSPSPFGARRGRGGAASGWRIGGGRRPVRGMRSAPRRPASPDWPACAGRACGHCAAAAAWPSGPTPYIASRSMMSRSRTLPSFSSSRHTVSASNVSGLSHSAPIISSRPASMRLAMAISPSRESSSTEPISRRYMRTGSSVRSYCSAAFAGLGGDFLAAFGERGHSRRRRLLPALRSR